MEDRELVFYICYFSKMLEKKKQHKNSLNDVLQLICRSHAKNKAI